MVHDDVAYLSTACSRVVQGFATMNLHRTIKIGVSTAFAASMLAALSIVVPIGAATASAGTPACSPANLPKSGVTDITFWEAMTSNNYTEIKALVADFNATHPNIKVTDVNEQPSPGGYEGEWDGYLADLKSNQSDLPNVGMFDQYITQGAVDSKSFIPAATCVAGTKYSTKSFAKKSLAEETVGGKLQALPYSISDPVLIYNTHEFAAGKIKTPPATFAAMAADAKKLKGVSYKYTYKGKTTTYTNSEGMTLKLDPWYLQIFQGSGGQDFVNNNNGRTGRASAAAFNDSIGLDTFTDLQNIVKAHDATLNPATGSFDTAYANLLDIGAGKSAMTIDSSATLGTIISEIPVIYPQVTLGVAPLPALINSSKGGVQPGGNALFLPSIPNESAAKLAASWEFEQWLDSATEMATWDVKTGYVPATSAAAATPIMKKYWKTFPVLKVAYTEISKGAVNDATAGPLLGDYYAVYNDLQTYEDDLLVPGNNPFPKPQTELTAAANEVTSDIKAYNSSL